MLLFQLSTSHLSLPSSSGCSYTISGQTSVRTKETFSLGPHFSDTSPSIRLISKLLKGFRTLKLVSQRLWILILRRWITSKECCFFYELLSESNYM